MDHQLLPLEPRQGSGVYGLHSDPRSALVHLVPVPFDATASYGSGTAGGPLAIRRASAQVDLLDPDFGRPYRAGIHMHPVPRAIAGLNRKARIAAGPVQDAAGGIGRSPAMRKRLAAVNQAGALVNAWVSEASMALLEAGCVVGVVGGDHSVPFGSIEAHARRWPGLGILHVDAHADLREAYQGFTWSHASIFHNVLTHVPEVARVVQIGIRDFSDEEWDRITGSGGRVVAFVDTHLRDEKASGVPWSAMVSRIVGELPQRVYVSFDIDGLDPSLCPHTGTPVPGGLSFHEACLLLRAVQRSGREIVGFDLCEVAPGPRGSDWDANVGARVLYKLIGACVASRVPGIFET
jgi:agmatinase